MSSPALILASASPRRQQLLAQLGLVFTTAEQDIDESRRAGESPAHYVQRLAQEKAASARRKLGPAIGTVILGADTIVVLDEVVMGKPQDELDARRMLLQLAGREHAVLSAVSLCSADQQQTVLSESRVQFRAISAREAASYWQTGEPRGKAGGYAIQGLAAVFVKELTGSYSGVMGLPLFETAGLLADFGIHCLPLQAEQ